MSTVKPITSPIPATYQSENAVHYGILMGGPKEIKWGGIGPFSIGHLSIPRRAIAEFNSMLVGHRNENDEAISDESARLHQDWEKNPKRLQVKPARACAKDVFELYGYRGWVIPNSLIGLSPNDAEQLFESVLPASVASQSLVKVIAHLSRVMESDTPQARLRNELLEAAFTAQAWITEYVRAMVGERELAISKGTGKRSFDPVDIEYFKEIERPLPTEEPALATLSMGKEIAKALDSKAEPAMNDFMKGVLEQLKATTEQNQALMTELLKSKSEESVIKGRRPKATETVTTVDNTGE